MWWRGLRLISKWIWEKQEMNYSRGCESCLDLFYWPSATTPHFWALFALGSWLYFSLESYHKWSKLPIPIYLGKTITWKDACTPGFIAAVFATAKTWKQPKYPSTEKWIKLCIYMHFCSSLSSGTFLKGPLLKGFNFLVEDFQWNIIYIYIYIYIYI